MPARNRRDAMPEPDPCEGRLSPWADAVTDAPGWQLNTRSRRLAVAVAAAVSGATVHPHQKGEWQARIPRAVLMVVVIDADAGALRCHLSARPRFRRLRPGLCAMAGHNRAEMPADGVAGTGTAIGTRCAGHHAHGPHGAHS